PDVGLSDLADPERLALVSAFRAEVAREVRAAEFSDLQGLVQGLSTGVLAALGMRPEGPPAGGPVLRLPPQVPFLAGREELLAGLDDQLATDRTAVAATMVTTAQSGRGAPAGAGGGGGGTGSVTAPPGGGRTPARAAGAPARDAMAATARPAAHRRMRGMPRPAGRGGGDALWWIIWVT